VAVGDTVLAVLTAVGVVKEVDVSVVSVVPIVVVVLDNSVVNVVVLSKIQVTSKH